MWLPLALLILVGTVSAEFEHGWKAGNEYTYLVRSRTLTGLHKLSDQYTGILLKALLTVQAKDDNILGAVVSKCQYARIHKRLPNGWDSEISDNMLELRDLPMSGKPFEMKIKHGVIRDLIVEKDTPTWEVNMLKSIVSQLQVDTQGENAIRSKSVQVPTDEEPYGMFRAIEDTVGGKCEVHYDITPLPEHMRHVKPELVPLPKLKGDGLLIDIMKTRNFSRCDQRVDYHFGITGATKWEPGSNNNGRFLTKSSTSRVIISGNLKRFTIQSSVTTSQLLVSPRFYDNQNGIVVSVMNLTIANMERMKNPLPSPRLRESTGNLVYVYNNPFSENEERRSNKRVEALNSNQILTSDSIDAVSSSEETLKKGEHLRRRGSKSSSASSSSISSSEEHEFWQPKPTLEDAPRNPFLPNFVGYNGKVIDKSDEINMIKAAKDLVAQMSIELEEPSEIPNHETLAKFTILSDLIRTMSRKQLKEVEKDIHMPTNELKSHDKSQAIKMNAWTVLRDAVTQAGTGPALLTIKDWIIERDLGGMEAANLLSKLPTTARTPTDEYIKVLLELATNPKVKNERFLNTTAILVFADLVRLAQVNGMTIHNRYPVHTFGRLTSKHDTVVVEKYIPYLARELTKAIKDGDSPRIQTYIVALGKIGHPRVLSIFEPYLEGKETITVFQRTLMVSSLSKMTMMFPKLTRPIFYKIYLNTMEAHEVRCIAVFLLMKTNPPFSMLQRMADFTNYDTSKHVNSAVKSSIISLAGLTIPGSEDLAYKARSVMNMLNPEDYSYLYSHSTIFDKVAEDQNQFHRIILKYIGSEDSITPRSIYYGLFSSYGGFKTPPTEVVGMISSMKPIFRMLFDVKDDKSNEKLKTEKLAEELNIMPEEPIPLEGNILINSKFGSGFLPFNKPELIKMFTAFSNNVVQTNGDYKSWSEFASYDVTLSFPTETGLPFVFTFNIPTLWKCSGKDTIQMNQGLNLDVESDVRLLFSSKIQGRIGFVTPFEHEHFVSGVDVNLQTYAPIKVKLGVDVEKKNLQMKIWPLKGEEKARLVHYSVVPYTSSHDIFSLRPLLTEKNTQIVHSGETVIVSKLVPTENIEPFRVSLETDKTVPKLLDRFWSLDGGVSLGFPWTVVNDVFCKTDLFMNLKHELKEPMIFTVALDTLNIKPGSEDLRQWTPIATTVEPSDKKADSVDRRKQFLREVSKGVKAAKATVVDLQLRLPGDLESDNVVTIAWTDSAADNKERSLFYWHTKVPSLDMQYEVCAAAQTVSTSNILPSYEHVMMTIPKKEFDIAVRYGKTCSENKEINIQGKLTQSTEMKEKVKTSAIVKECQGQMKHGNKILKACQKAASLAMLLDEVDVSLDIPDKSLLELAETAVGLVAVSDYVDSRIAVVKPQNAGKKKIDIKARLSNNLQSADVLVETSSMDAMFNKIDLSPMQITSEDLESANGNLNEMIDHGGLDPSCTLDKTRVETFDGRDYPMRLGNCWHVVMTTFPTLNPVDHSEKLRIPKEMSVTILARETEDGRKAIKILLGNQEILLLPGDSQPKVKLNDKDIEVTKDKSYQERRNDEIIFEIFRLADDSIGVTSDEHDIYLVYDGQRMSMKAWVMYRNSIRGLCGNYDGDATNDFWAPKNCIMRRPEEFVAAYALTKDQCEGEALEMAKKVHKFECMRQVRNRPSNVISDVDAGRTNEEIQKWGYHKELQSTNKRCNVHRTKVIEMDDKICFSIRPIAECSASCTATETKSKNYQFHCMERNEASLSMQKRVEKGANPDLSQKPVSMTKAVNTPLACEA
ncbi:vitellogenin-like [Hylaeus volcanicus]|uniref:vitellogenin-like n=1 Tax=Hylaeus volcanicus TaxID=313075 RepID=UPI0023B7FAF5|nr:vitellogenin-like [Hylaeus volcanicus]